MRSWAGPSARARNFVKAVVAVLAVVTIPAVASQSADVAEPPPSGYANPKQVGAVFAAPILSGKEELDR